MDLLLSPHNDDAELFAAYTCLRHRPLVWVCLRSFVEASWPEGGPSHEVREAETDAALAVLGCGWRQLTVRDDAPDWGRLVDEFLDARETLRPDRVWAPWPEPGGHPHHNEVGELAGAVFDRSEVRYYTTYTHAGGRTTGPLRVPVEPGWEGLKRRALACYRSQREHPRTRGGFLWPLDEYLAPRDDTAA